eukprot:gene4026-4995_t
MSAPPEILPLEVIVHILQFLPFPGRQQASQVCRRWRHASSDPCFTIRVSPRPRAISAAISSAPEGATIVLSPGYYQASNARDPWCFDTVGGSLQRCRRAKDRTAVLAGSSWLGAQETVLVCKPVRILGETTETAAGGSRLGVVVEGHASTAIISGGSNLRLPNINPPGRLLLTNTCINSTAARDYAIHIGVPSASRCFSCSRHPTGAAQFYPYLTEHSGGTAAIRGCTITGNRGAGVGIAQGAHASITNNDVSFNGRAGIFVAGSGTIRDNIIWGNRGHSIDIDAGHVWGSCTFSNNHVKKRDVLTAEDHLRTSFLEHMHANIQELPPELPLDPNQGVGNVLEEAAVAMNVGGLLELVQGAALAAAAAGNDVVGDIQALQQQQHGADAHEEDEEDNEEEDEDEDENEEATFALSSQAKGMVHIQQVTFALSSQARGMVHIQQVTFALSSQAGGMVHIQQVTFALSSQAGGMVHIQQEDDEEPQGAGDVAAMDEEAAPFLHNVSHIAQIIMGGGGPPYQ